MGAIDRSEAVRRLDGAGIAYASVNSVADLSVHAQLRRTTANAPEGPVALPAWPAIVSDVANADSDVPSLGQHNDRIRAEFTDAAAVQDAERPWTWIA
jgi:crotonobetainyl-CoA:carnitine CoA-transferase CaiB-like acyl-CoA transferase